MQTEFKLEYIAKNQRDQHYKLDTPLWKNKINEIQNKFSETLDKIRAAIPNYTNGCPSEDWNPFWITVYEIQSEFNLPGEDYQTEYQINHQTLKITCLEE